MLAIFRIFRYDGAVSNQAVTPQRDIAHIYRAWIAFLCSRLGVKQITVAKEAGIARSALSPKRPYHPSRDMLIKVFQAFQRLAERQNISLDDFEEAFLNSCGYASDEQQQRGTFIFDLFDVGEHMAMEIQRLRAENQKLRTRMQAQESEHL
jgi:hypothetical protein